MYEKFFGLEKNPFAMTPDPAFLWLTGQHREAAAGLGYAIIARKGFAVLTGEAGTGKTTIISKVLHNLANRVQVSLIINPTVNVSEFLEMTLLDFQVADVPSSKAQRIARMQQLLLDNRAAGRTTTLIVDEAHKLSNDVLEELRLLGNFERDEKLLQILLVGQPELDSLLNREDLRQLKQRIALRFSIAPLACAEVVYYIAHRWSTAGGQLPPPFSDEAIAQIASVSRGIPRVINSVCDNALLLAFSEARRAVAAEDVRDAAQDLRLIDRQPAPAAVSAPQAAKVEAAPVLRLPLEAPALRTLERLRVPEARPSLWARWTAKLGFTN